MPLSGLVVLPVKPSAASGPAGSDASRCAASCVRQSRTQSLRSLASPKILVLRCPSGCVSTVCPSAALRAFTGKTTIGENR